MSPSPKSQEIDIRRLRFRLSGKLLLGFGLTVALFLGLSTTLLLKYFFDDKLKYILYSLYQGSQSLCSKLETVKPEAFVDELKKTEFASTFLLTSQDLVVTHKNIFSDLDPEVEAKVAASVGLKIQNSKIPNLSGLDHLTLTSGRKLKYLYSACSLNLSPTEAGAETSAANPLPNWLVLFSDSDEALQPAKDYVKQLALIMLALTMTCLGAVLIMSRHFTRPLQTLALAADELGAGNYKYSWTIKNNDEFGVLSDHLRLLGRRLHTRETELEKTTELANRDSLTGLWNRRYFERRVHEFFEAAKRYNRSLSIVFLDLDHFKKINDTLGHQAGDEVLKEMASILKTNIREIDFVARIGGEEFVCVLPETAAEGALMATQKLQAAIRQHSFLGASKHKVTASLGVSSFDPRIHLTELELIEEADKLAYASKTGGRNRITDKSGTHT